jgi:hypothetical protein
MSEQLLRDFGTQLQTVLTQLAQGLGVAAEFVFRILIKQQVAEGVTHIFVVLFFIILSIVLVKIYIKRILIPTMRDYDKYSSDEDKAKMDKLSWFVNDDSTAIALGVIIGIIVVASLIAVPINLTSGVQKLINPEYFALKDIMSMINPPSVSK